MQTTCLSKHRSWFSERTDTMKHLKTEVELKHLIAADSWMMEIIATVERLELPDSWICAGFIRSKVWDYLHHYESRTPLGDIDVIYFDKANLSEKMRKSMNKN